MKKVFCEYSCFLARGGQQAACQKCQGKNAKGKILNVIIILLGLFVIIYGVIYSYKKNDEIRRPRRSFMLAYFFFIMNTPTIYTLSFYYVYDEHV